MYLTDLPNIGKTLAGKLTAEGVRSAENLKSLGSLEAFRLIRRSDPDACYSLFCAPEGAVRGIRRRQLPEAVKEQLKQQYDRL